MNWILLGIEPTKDKKAITSAYRAQLVHTNPEDKPEEFKDTFDKVLENADEIIHFSMTSKMSLSTQFAIEAAEKYDGRVHVVDTGHLSTGMCFMMIRAHEMIQEGKSVTEILDEMENMKSKVSTTFITESTDCLYRNGRVNEFVKNVCTLFKIHPVLTLSNGVMKMKYFQIGSYEKSAMRYIRKELRKTKNINKQRVFITKCSCPLKLINMVKEEVKERCEFKEMIVNDASATVSSNCGKNTFGVLFVRE